MSQPFLKWAGGKRWFAERYIDEFPSKFGRYFEPFLGSGAVYFALEPKNALISDSNIDLIDTYRAIRDGWLTVEQHLSKHHFNHDRSHYYNIRSTQYEDRFQRAASFIYLNRTCWNGLYRVNLKGEFNVPIGSKENVILSSDNFSNISAILHNAKIEHSDFELVIDGAGSGDLVYLDPPYAAKHIYNGFVKYNEVLFGWEDQIRLRDCAIRARNRGAHVVISNANHPSIRELYNFDCRIITLTRNSVIASKAHHREQISELLIKLE